MYDKAAILGDFNLALLDFRVVKFFHTAALQAYQMIMVGAACQLKYGLAPFKMVALEQPCLFELRQYPIDCGKSDIFAFAD